MGGTRRFFRLAALRRTVRARHFHGAAARQRARDKERLSRKTVEPTVYELTLKQAGLPGLPPPMTKTNAVNLAGSPNGAEAEPAEEAAPVVDATLEETQRILLDYINLLARKGIAANARPTSATVTP